VLPRFRAIGVDPNMVLQSVNWANDRLAGW